MEMSYRTNADFMLRNALLRTETPSPELLKKIRSNAINDGTVVRIHPKSRRFALAAILVALLLTISTVALAYTGVLSDIFSSITGGSVVNGGIGSNSRKAIVDQGYVAGVTPDASVSIDGNTMELIAYYADAKEIGFSLRLSGTELPDSWDRICFDCFTFEMTGSDGVTNTWEDIVDLENGFERRTFPGGYFYEDWNRNIIEYEPSDGKDPMESIAVADIQDFQHYAAAERVDETTYDITLIVSFHKANVQIGEFAHLSIGDLRFITFCDISDDNAVDQHASIEGTWEFDLNIDKRFTDVTELQYSVVNADELAGMGIVIESVTVLPSVCRIEAAIDFDKAGLANPENIYQTDSPRLLGKLDWLDSHIHAVSGSDVYGGMTSSYTEVNGRVVKCYYEIGSMFFEAPENLTLILIGYEGYNGLIIEIPLVLDKQW